MENKGLELVQRPLTMQEQEIVAWLIEHGSCGEKSRFKSQIALLSVRERCRCGCPTVYFSQNGVAVPRKGETILSDHEATVDGQGVGVMLFENEGLLSSLEVYSCAGSGQPFGLPKLEDIRA